MLTKSGVKTLHKVKASRLLWPRPVKLPTWQILKAARSRSTAAIFKFTKSFRRGCRARGRHLSPCFTCRWRLLWGSVWPQVNVFVFGEGFFFQIFFKESHLGIGAIPYVVTNDVDRSQHRTQYQRNVDKRTHYLHLSPCHVRGRLRLRLPVFNVRLDRLAKTQVDFPTRPNQQLTSPTLSETPVFNTYKFSRRNHRGRRRGLRLRRTRWFQLSMFGQALDSSLTVLLARGVTWRVC